MIRYGYTTKGGATGGADRAMTLPLFMAVVKLFISFILAIACLPFLKKLLLAISKTHVNINNMIINER